MRSLARLLIGIAMATGWLALLVATSFNACAVGLGVLAVLSISGRHASSSV